MRNILIAEEKIDCFPMPWKFDSTCFNFRVPDEHFRSSEELCRSVDMTEIETLVIARDQEDYSFISKMTGLRYLYVYSGEKLTDMSFIEDLVCLQHLCLRKTHIASFEPLIRLGENKYKRFTGADDLFSSLNRSIRAVYIESDCLELDLEQLKKSEILSRTSEFFINRKNYADLW